MVNGDQEDVREFDSSRADEPREVQYCAANRLLKLPGKPSGQGQFIPMTAYTWPCRVWPMVGWIFQRRRRRVSRGEALESDSLAADRVAGQDGQPGQNVLAHGQPNQEEVEIYNHCGGAREAQADLMLLLLLLLL